jgi:hypothetical protein
MVRREAGREVGLAAFLLAPKDDDGSAGKVRLVKLS